MKKSFKVITIVLIILVLCIIAMIGYYLKNGKNDSSKKNGKNFNISDKSIESDNMIISVDNVSYNGNYLILKYDLKTKIDYSEVFEELNIDDEFELILDRKIEVNDEKLDIDERYTEQVPLKISNNEVIVYDVIDVTGKNFPENNVIEVSFFENEITAYEKTSNDYGDNDYDREDEEELEIEEDELEQELDLIDPDEYYEQSEQREGSDEQEVTDEIENDLNEELNEEDNTDLGLLEENATPEDYEEVQGEYVWDEEDEQEDEDEEYDDTEDGVLIGTLKFDCKLSEIENNVSTKMIEPEYISNNLNIDNISIIKTIDSTILIVNSKISDLNYDNIYMQEIGDPYSYRISVNNDNNEVINSSEKSEITITDIDGNSEENIDNNSKDISATVKTRIVLNNNDISKLKLKPFYYLEDGGTESMGEGFDINF